MFLSFQFLVFLLISFSFLLLLLIPFKYLSSASKTKKNIPPSPPKLPIIGNFHQLGSSNHRSFRELSRKHGPLVLIHLGSVPVLVVSSAEAAREIMKTHDLVFSSRPKLYIPDKLTFGSKDIAFAPYGEHWRQVKSITVLHLLSNKQVQSFREIRENRTTSMINMMGKNCGSVVNLSEMIVSLTYDIICEVSLGRKYGDHLMFKDSLRRFSILVGTLSVGSYIPWLSWVDWLRGLEGKTNRVLIELGEFFEGIIQEHINNNKTADEKVDQRKDLVDILLDLQKGNTSNFTLEKDTIKGVILDVFGGGTDTTSTNMEWALSELVRNPRIMKKLQTEVHEIAQGRSMITEDDIQEMPYLKAVIKEALRLHTPLPLLVARETTQNVKIMGYDITQGTQVMINAWAISRDPFLWDEPETFKPERFLDSSIDYKGFDFEYLPFGAGRRICPGTRFAIVINQLVLANIVYKYDLALPNNAKPEELDMSEINGQTVHKKSPLLVVPTPRF